MLAIVPDQLRQLAGEQHREGEQPGDVDQQYPRQPALEGLRVLGSRGEQEQGREPQCDADGAEHRGTVLADYGWSVHVYQSLSRCQSLTQNMTTRKVNGTEP